MARRLSETYNKLEKVRMLKMKGNKEWKNRTQQSLKEQDKMMSFIFSNRITM